MLMYFLWLSDTNDVPAAPATAGCEEELPPPGPTNICLGCSYSRLRFFFCCGLWFRSREEYDK